MTSPQPNQPWLVSHLVRLCWGQSLAAVALIASWFGVSHTGHASHQVNWLVLAISGLAVAVAVSVNWLTIGRRAVGLRRGRLVDAVSDTFDDTVSGSDDAVTGLVAGGAMTHYHRADCQLVRGKQITASSLRDHLRAARTPCAVCRP